MYFTNQNKVFEQRLIDDAIRHAQDIYPNECAGAIIGNEYVRFENKSPTPSASFLIDDMNFKMAYMYGAVECVIHSHCDCKPLVTREDQISQEDMDVPYGIVQLKNKSVTHVTFWGDTLPIEPLLGRYFYYGAFDCYGLVRDWIRMNHKVTPPNPNRDWVFWYNGVSMFEMYVQSGKMPYEFVDLRDIEYGDILLYNINGTKYMNHCGVMLGNKVLHHFDNSLSAEYPYAHYREYLTLAVRHIPNWEGYNDSSIWKATKEIH
jgi:proteasome lid subunit RPN8/RPN11